YNEQLSSKICHTITYPNWEESNYCESDVIFRKYDRIKRVCKSQLSNALIIATSGIQAYEKMLMSSQFNFVHDVYLYIKYKPLKYDIDKGTSRDKLLQHYL